MNDTFIDVPSQDSAGKRTGPPRIVIIILAGIVAIVATWFSPLDSQKRSLLAAQQHADRTAPQLHADARFQKIKLETFTGMGGCLWVTGPVDTDEDANALRAMIASARPPILTHFVVWLDTSDRKVTELARLPDLPPGGL